MWGPVLNPCENDTAFAINGIPAFSVHGALSDHHRLIRQFGAVPLMYYLFGET
jgi:hypothetical protein